MDTRDVAVSVVIPLYNKENLVEACLNSVINQKVKPMEIIIIDDGSTDKSYEIVQSVMSNCSIPYQLFSQRNTGVASARNMGVDVCQGEFVAFLDADDIWSSDFILEMSELIRKYPGAALYSCSHTIFNGSVIRNNLCEVFEEGECGVVKNFFEIYSKVSLVNSSKVIINKSIFNYCGGFPAGVSVNEDIYLWIQIAMQGDVAYLQRDLVTINQIEDESRIFRIGVMPYIIEFYSKNRLRMLDDFHLKKFLWRVCYSHYFSSLVNNKKYSSFLLFKKIFLMFPIKSFLLFPFLFFPRYVISFIVNFKRRF